MMKKITFLFILLAISLGYSQSVLENFEGTAPTFNYFDGATNPATIIADPAAGGANGNVLQIVTNTAGAAWQGTEMLFQGDYVDLTTTKTITVDVYSTSAQNFLLKVDGGETTGPASATDASYTTPGAWQTLTFDFTDNLDGSGVANDVYTRIIIFPAWENLGGSCNAGCYSTNIGNNAPPLDPILLDNITGIASAPAETCNDGILNNGETEIDCGGPNCDACDPLPATAAPNPPNYTSHLALQDNITDTGSFTNFWNADDFFGATPEFVDLDDTAVENNAAKINLSIGWGGGQTAGGNLATTDVSSYDTVHFDYYIPSAVAAGVNGHQFFLDLISRTGGANTESFYGIGVTVGGAGSGVVDEVIVFDTWQGVDVPMTTFVGKGFDSSNFFQFKIGAQSDIRTKLGYFDNIYFYDSATLGTNQFDAVEFSLYPNPTQDSWTIETQNVRISSITVYDVLGKSVMAMELNEDRAVVDGSSLKSGLYFAKVETAEGVSSVKLIKK